MPSRNGRFAASAKIFRHSLRRKFASSEALRRVSAAKSCQEKLGPEAVCSWNHMAPSRNQLFVRWCPKDGIGKADRLASSRRPRAYLGAGDLTRKLIHRLGELDVAFGQTAGIVRGQGHLDGLVDVEPFRMVIHLFGDERGPRHKAEGGIEVGEYEFLGDGVAAGHLAPPLEAGRGGLAGVAGEFLAHGKTP